MKILLATGNKGKLDEMKLLFEGANFKDVELVCLKDLEEVEEPVEDGDTFLANAYIKVMYYYNQFKIPTISDDTGLLVDALGGAPGVHTARYASLDGESHPDPVDNYMKLLREMKGKTNRRAAFKTAMYFYDGKTLISSVGEMVGEIAEEPSGDMGHGYDPVFYYPEYKKTVAHLTNEEKNVISHRGYASRLLITQLKNYFK